MCQRSGKGLVALSEDYGQRQEGWVGLLCTVTSSFPGCHLRLGTVQRDKRIRVG